MTIWIKGSHHIEDNEFNLSPIPCGFDGEITPDKLACNDFIRYDDWGGLRFFARKRHDGSYREIHVGIHRPETYEYERIGDLYLDPVSPRQPPSGAYVSGVGFKTAYRGLGYGYLLYTHIILNLGVLLASDTVHYEGSRNLWLKLASDKRVTVYTDLNEHKINMASYKPDFRQVFVKGEDILVDGADEDDVWLPTTADAHWREGPSARPSGVSLTKYNRVLGRRLYGVSRLNEKI